MGWGSEICEPYVKKGYFYFTNIVSIVNFVPSHVTKRQFVATREKFRYSNGHMEF